MTNITERIEILFENGDVLVVNKPSGLMVHPDGYNAEKTLTDWFLEYCPSAQGVGEPMEQNRGPQKGTVIDRPGVVHRLDTETSGVLVLAKHQEAYEHLKKQFHDRHVHKEYRAFVYGKMKEDHGTIDRPIGRSARDFRLRSAQRGAKGTLRDALTEWELIDQNDECAYLKLMPKTGRTHQIRVHLKAINHPVIADDLYATNHEPALGFDRLALHAYTLSLTLPDGAEHTFTASLPESFLAAEKQLHQ